MAEPRQPHDPPVPGEDEHDSVPEHRVVWDPAAHPSAPPPPSGPVGRATVRMTRPPLPSPWGPTSTSAPPVVAQVVEVVPTTERQPKVQPRALTSTLALVHPARPVLAPHVPAPAIGTPERPQLLRPPGVLDPRLVMLVDPDSARAASFRVLRDNLLAKNLPRVLAISSATPKEGKTTCALNLALALAERPSTTVLLIDANFFEPALGSIFTIDERTPTSPSLDFPWLAPYRLAELTPCLHVAAIVRRKDEPPPRYDKQRFDILIDRLSRIGYDRLIIDAPALESSPAVSQIVGAAEAVLLAVRAGKTTMRALRRAVGQIPEGKAIGTALMDADPPA